jgi:hypothetical protein
MNQFVRGRIGALGFLPWNDYRTVEPYLKFDRPAARSAAAALRRQLRGASGTDARRVAGGPANFGAAFVRGDCPNRVNA